MTESQTWTEVGTACIGGSIVGLVFAVAQYTLDEQGRARQIAGDVRLMVTSTSAIPASWGCRPARPSVAGPAGSGPGSSCAAPVTGRASPSSCTAAASARSC